MNYESIKISFSIIILITGLIIGNNAINSVKNVINEQNTRIDTILNY